MDGIGYHNQRFIHIKKLNTPPFLCDDTDNLRAIVLMIKSSFWAAMIMNIFFWNFNDIWSIDHPRPDICHLFSTNVLLGSIILHIKARKLWQNFPTFPKIFQIFPKFPHNCHTLKAEIFHHDNFFSKNIIRDISDKYQVSYAKPNTSVNIAHMGSGRLGWGVHSSSLGGLMQN